VCLSFLGLVENGSLDTLSAGKGDEGLGALANCEHVTNSGGELLSNSVLDVDNVEGTRVLLLGDNNTNTTQIASASNHNKVANVKLNEVDDFAGLDINLHCVVNFDEGIWVTDGSSIVKTDVRNTLVSSSGVLHLGQFVVSLLVCDSLDSKSTLCVEQQTEVLVGLFDADDIHETRRICGVSSDFAINLDVSLHHNAGDFLSGEGVLKTVSQENDQRQTFTQLVRSRGRSRCKNTRQFVQHPMYKNGCWFIF